MYNIYEFIEGNYNEKRKCQWEIITLSGMHERLLSVVKISYKESLSYSRINGGTSERLRHIRVRQGFVISPGLLNIFTDAV